MASFHTPHIYANWGHRRGPRPDGGGGGGVEEPPNGTTSSVSSGLKIAQALRKRMETSPVITWMVHIDNGLYASGLPRSLGYKPQTSGSLTPEFSFLSRTHLSSFVHRHRRPRPPPLPFFFSCFVPFVWTAVAVATLTLAAHLLQIGRAHV